MSKVYVRDVHSGFINADHIVAVVPDRDLILIHVPGDGPARSINVRRGSRRSGAEPRDEREMNTIALNLVDAILVGHRNPHGSIVHWDAESESWAIH